MRTDVLCVHVALPDRAHTVDVVPLRERGSEVTQGDALLDLPDVLSQRRNDVCFPEATVQATVRCLQVDPLPKSHCHC